MIGPAYLSLLPVTYVGCRELLIDIRMRLESNANRNGTVISRAEGLLKGSHRFREETVI